MMKHFHTRYNRIDKLPRPLLAFFQDDRHGCDMVLFDDDKSYYIASYNAEIDRNGDELIDAWGEGDLISESEIDFPKTNPDAKYDAWSFFADHVKRAIEMK